MLYKENIFGDATIKNVVHPGSFDKFHRETDNEMAWAETVYIKKVIYHNPATIILWSDGTSTKAKCHPDDKYSPESGLLVCIMKKLKGSNGFRDLINTWLQNDVKEKDVVVRTLSDVRKDSKKK